LKIINLSCSSKICVFQEALVNNLTTVNSPALPIGLAYIVAAIKDIVDVEAIDPIAGKPLISDVTPFTKGTSILGLTPDETINMIKKKPDVCLFSSMFSLEWPVAKILINLIKEKFPDCIIVGGGEHFTALPEYSLENSSLDLCVIGEGEATIRDLMERMIAGVKIPLDVPGTVVRDPQTQKIIRNEKRNRIKQIHEVIAPAWEYFDVNGFLDVGAGQMGNGIDELRAMPFVASRGCPYECTFCSNPSMWGKLWKPRPPQEVIDEWKFLMKEYRANHFDSCDLTAIVKKSWIVEFCNLLIKENLPVTWGLPSGTRSEALDYEVLQLLKRAGCNDLDYAPESGSDYILKIIKKKINKDKMVESIRDCNRVGINSKANIIFGFPEEKRRHVFESYYFICRLAWAGVNDVLVGTFSPYPGSAIFEKLKKEGKIIMDEKYFEDLAAQGSIDVMSCHSNHYSKTWLYLFKMGGYALFYSTSLLLRPNRLWVFVRDLATGVGTTRVSRGLINIFARWRQQRFGLNSTSQV
jgi:anaerobic magnesium-protoporphyrin IX monomethyl ester cyclase